MEQQNGNLPAVTSQTHLDAPGLNAGAEIVDRWLSSLDAKPTTLSTYRRAIKSFLSWTAQRGITRPLPDDILAYKRHLTEEAKSTFTVNAYLTATRRFFAYLEAQNLYPDIAKNIKGMKKPKGFMKDSLTADQARRLTDSISTKSLAGLRDLALVNLMLRTGLREIEIARADVGDICQESGELVLRVQRKGSDSKDDFVLLTGEAYTPIADYLGDRGRASNDEPLFVATGNRRSTDGRLTVRAIRNIIDDRLERAGLKKEMVTGHSLRHTAATLAFKGGADVVQVKDMLGHQNINTTMIYVHSMNRVADGAEKRIQF